jgi:hypothetical protein
MDPRIICDNPDCDFKVWMKIETWNKRPSTLDKEELAAIERAFDELYKARGSTKWTAILRALLKREEVGA